MAKYEKNKNVSSYIKRYTSLLILAWSIIVFVLIVWNSIQVNEDMQDSAHIYTSAAFDKDILYRRWAAMHGGVYVPVTNITLPNPYLSHVPERDVTTLAGKNLTLMNPAYMSRQVYEFEKEFSEAYSHITSLNPINPENGPDVWEKNALEAFEQGAVEVSSIEFINGREYFRLMQPFTVEDNCLKCHAEQGYEVGDIRGGISVSLPMDSIRELASTTYSRNISIYLVIWLTGTASIIFGYFRIRESELKRKQAEENLKQYAEELKSSNELKDLFTDILRHDLLNPAGIVKGYTELLLDMEKDEKKQNLLNKIEQNNEKLINMIETAAKFAKFESVEELEFETLDIGGIFKIVVDNFKPKLEENRMILEFVAEDKYPANVNMIIEEVFANLISNAIKYSPEENKIVVDILDAGKDWKVTVADFGEGISDGDKQKIFSRFQRVDKTAVKGSGLGLAIVKRIIELHGGNFGVEDNPEGVGSVFWVTIRK